MTHLEVAATRKSLRKHTRILGELLLDIEHFKVPAVKPRHVNGHAAYTPHTHIAFAISTDGVGAVGISRTHPTADTYNRKRGMEIAFGRALYALSHVGKRQSSHPTSRVQLNTAAYLRQGFRRREYTTWRLIDVPHELKGIKLRDYCRDRVLALKLLNREETFQWKRLLETTLRKRSESMPSDAPTNSSTQPPAKKRPLRMTKRTSTPSATSSTRTAR